MDQDHQIAGARLKIIGLYAISVCGRADLRILASCHAPLHPGSLVMPRAARASASGQSVTREQSTPLLLLSRSDPSCPALLDISRYMLDIVCKDTPRRSEMSQTPHPGYEPEDAMLGRPAA